MKYKLIKRGNPGNSTDPKKWHTSPVKTGTITQKSLAKEIAGRSSLTSGDFSTDKIKGLKILFTPGTDFKRDLSSIKFEHDK